MGSRRRRVGARDGTWGAATVWLSLAKDRPSTTPAARCKSATTRHWLSACPTGDSAVQRKARSSLAALMAMGMLHVAAVRSAMYRLCSDWRSLMAACTCTSAPCLAGCGGAHNATRLRALLRGHVRPWVSSNAAARDNATYAMYPCIQLHATSHARSPLAVPLRPGLGTTIAPSQACFHVQVSHSLSLLQLCAPSHCRSPALN